MVEEGRCLFGFRGSGKRRREWDLGALTGALTGVERVGGCCNGVASVDGILGALKWVFKHPLILTGR